MKVKREIEIWELCKERLVTKPAHYYLCNVLSELHYATTITESELDLLTAKISERLEGRATYLSWVRYKQGMLTLSGLTLKQDKDLDVLGCQAKLRIMWCDLMIAELRSTI